jgi:tetratricopeptide (TPR) repeat protein
MRAALVLLLTAVLAACATAPATAPHPETLFHDELFAAPTERIGADEIFAVSEPMRRYLHEDIASQIRSRGRQDGLIDALYSKGQLRLDYDAAVTRNAAEAFAARSGNCLSLVIMTAALAKELQLKVRYQSAYLEETWSRSGSLLLRSGHVNVTLEPRLADADRFRVGKLLTIDFLPPSEIRGLRTIEIDEDMIVAMFMNNRAVEALVQGRVDDGYAWAREAIRRKPAFMSAYVTLGTVYLRSGALPFAEQVFGHVLAAQPDNTRAMANLVQTLTRQGKLAEAESLRQRLAQLESAGPYHYFNLGMAAMKREDFRSARELFAKEVARAEYNAEFRHWLGVASFKLGDHAEAAKHLALAQEYSTSRDDRDLYAAKLAWLKSHGAH